MPLTEAVVKSLGPAVRLPLASGSLCIVRVRKPCSFSQAASWARVVVPAAYRLKSSVTARPSFGLDMNSPGMLRVAAAFLSPFSRSTQQDS